MCPVCGKLNCSFLHELEAKMLTSEALKRKGQPMFRADKEYCLTGDGKLCEPDDKQAATVLVHKGGTLPMATAIKYGLVAPAGENSAESEPAPAKSQKPNLDLRRGGRKRAKPG